MRFLLRRLNPSRVSTASVVFDSSVVKTVVEVHSVVVLPCTFAPPPPPHRFSESWQGEASYSMHLARSLCENPSKCSIFSQISDFRWHSPNALVHREGDWDEIFAANIHISDSSPQLTGLVHYWVTRFHFGHLDLRKAPSSGFASPRDLFGELPGVSCLSKRLRFWLFLLEQKSSKIWLQAICPQLAAWQYASKFVGNFSFGLQRSESHTASSTTGICKRLERIPDWQQILEHFDSEILSSDLYPNSPFHCKIILSGSVWNFLTMKVEASVHLAYCWSAWATRLTGRPARQPLGSKHLKHSARS